MHLLLPNGLIVDGSGGTPFRGDVLINGEHIADCAPRTDKPSDAIAIECENLVVAPGCVDIHSHSDVHVLGNAPEKVHQGVTSEVVGNCGFSAFPSCRNRSAVQEYANAILHGNTDWGWASAREYLEQAANESRIANVYSLTGHGTLRVSQAGFAQGRLAAAESDAMVATLSECLEKRAIGFSTGLRYGPGSSALPEELTVLCKATANHGGIYCTHMRSYSRAILESLEEQIRLAQATGCRLQISHFQAVGRVNWDKQEAALERMEKARAAGRDIEFDIYPYLAGSTVLTQLLPQAALDGGTGALLRRLSNESERRDIVRETQSSLAQSWEDVIITSVRTTDKAIVRLSIAAVAELRGLPPAETVVDLLMEESAAINIVSFNQSEPNLRALLTHPLCTVISDGFYVNGRPHRHLFGTFPDLLGRYFRDQKWLTLPEAIHKITRKPAERFKLVGRGSLQPGAFADITVFDPETIRSQATYSNPERAPEGIELVLRNGREVFRRNEANAY